MYLAYSAIWAPEINKHSSVNEQVPMNHEMILRYEAYKAVCSKLSREIEAIQKYNPGWMPRFNR